MSILPISIIGWYNIQTTKDSLIATIQEKQVSVVQRSATEVNHLLAMVSGRMKLLIDASNMTDLANVKKEKIEQSLYSLLKQNSEIENAHVYNQNGEIIASALRWQTNLSDLSIEKDIKDLLKGLDSFNHGNKTLQVSQVYFKDNGQPYIYLLTPFINNDQSTSGGMIVEVNLQSTFKKISSIYTGRNGYIYILDQNNNLIAHTDYSQVLLGKDVIRSSELRDMVKNKDVMYPMQYKSYTGKKVIGAYAPIPSTNWGVVIEQPIEKAFATIDFLIRRLIFTLLLMIGIVVLISIIFGVWFTKPIELMGKAVRKVSEGHLDTKIPYKAKDEFGQLSQAFNHMTDEIKQKSETLKQEKERLDTIINGSGAGFALVHGDYRVSWMNPRLEEWLAENSDGISCYSLLGRLSEPCKDCPLSEDIIEQNGNEVINTINQKGETKIYSHRMYPLEHTNEGEPKYLIMVEDITEQRNLEEMVVQADKLSALGILASGFAHEVNNPLASISAYAEDLKERIKEESPEELVQSGEMDHYLDIIKNNVDRCKVITGNLLNFSRKSTNSSLEINLAQTVEDSLILLQHVLKKKNIQLINEINSNIPIVFGDSMQIQQVLINIMQNAIDSMDDGGRLEIDSYVINDKIVLLIEDNGSGISKEQLNKVFDPFYTTKPVGKGTGLGLYISYNIMKKWNGDILIESQENVGTKISIVFPILKQ